MSTPFAAIETRLGQTAAALLADATLTAGALSIDGMLDEAIGVELSLSFSRSRFICAAGTDADELDEGDAVTVTKNAVAIDYLIATPPIFGGGQTVLNLVRAS